MKTEITRKFTARISHESMIVLEDGAWTMTLPPCEFMSFVRNAMVSMLTSSPTEEKTIIVGGAELQIKGSTLPSLLKTLDYVSHKMEEINSDSTTLMFCSAYPVTAGEKMKISSLREMGFRVREASGDEYRFLSSVFVWKNSFFVWLNPDNGRIQYVNSTIM